MTTMIMLAACTQHQPRDNEVGGFCNVDASTVIEPDDPGSTGVSADEVIARLDGTTVAVRFVRTQEELATTAFTSEFTLSAALAGDVEQQERTAWPLDDGQCITGTVGYAPLHITLSSEDVWTVGPDFTTPTVTWRGAENEVWVDFSVAAGVAQWLEDDAAANYDCTAGGAMPNATGIQTFRIGARDDFDTPWSTGPVVITLDCEQGPIATIFSGVDD